MWYPAISKSQSNVVYSTTEQEVGTWIDGRPVYEITFQINTKLPYGTSTTASIDLIDISSYNISRVIDFNASTKCNQDRDDRYQTYFNGVRFFIHLNDNSGYFRGYQQIASAYNQINWDTIITIRYVKNTST